MSDHITYPKKECQPGESSEPENVKLFCLGGMHSSLKIVFDCWAEQNQKSQRTSWKHVERETNVDDARVENGLKMFLV